MTYTKIMIIHYNHREMYQANREIIESRMKLKRRLKKRTFLWELYQHEICGIAVYKKTKLT